MKPLLGYWLICEAIIIFITIVIGGMELDTKAIAGEILAVSVFFTMLCIGSYLMTGGM